MNVKQFRYSLLALFIICQLFLQAQGRETKKVLFVGNSYTYFWNLPQSVACLAQDKSVKLETRQSTSGGVNLGQHWQGKKGLKTRSIIKRNEFDIVILQDHSRQTIDHLDSLLYYGELLGDLIKSQDAQPYVYMTWAREWDPYMQAEISAGYAQLAKLIDAKIVPVGPAWEKARSLRPGLELYDIDGSHPSPMGTYLTACVFYSVLTGETPIGLPHRLVTTDKDGQKLYLNIQSQNDALFLQKVAEEVVNTYGED